MTVLTRSALELSPLADLHAIASELGIDGFRRLRKPDLVDTIIGRQSGEEGGTPGEDALEGAAPKRARRRRGGVRDEDGGTVAVEVPAARAARAPRDRAARPAAAKAEPSAPRKRPVTEERIVEGVVELMGNGSAFLRVAPPDPSDDDVYISAAQVRRCELVSGDRISGPARPPRRSERYSSMIRVDTINDAPAEEVAEGARYDELPAAFPTQRFALSSEDPTLQAIEWLTPIGRGSRVTIVGGPRAGKTEALRRLVGWFAAQDDLEVSLVLVGVRPEEIGEAGEGPVAPAAGLSFAAGADAQGQAVERAVETAKRMAARGGDAVMLIDTLDGLHPAAARRALAAARNIAGGGSLTVIATSTKPVGGETTVVALDPALASTGRLPALDVAGSGTLRPELLVGETGAAAIAQARVEALG
jgi:transcription termination factor Rho